MSPNQLIVLSFRLMLSGGSALASRPNGDGMAAVSYAMEGDYELD